MNLKLELLQPYLSDGIRQYLKDLDLDVNQIVDTKATQMLGEIRSILQNTALDDFEMVEEIAEVFRNNHVSVGGCHDF